MKWQYFNNQMQVVGQRNYKLAMAISSYHYATLKAASETKPDPDFTTLYQRYAPLHLALKEEYSKWHSQDGKKQGETLNVNQLLAQMADHMKVWLPKIQLVHPKDSARYEAIFPQRTAGFYKGAKEIRISAVGVLKTALTNEPALSDVLVEVTAYHTQLVNARQQQLSAKGQTKSSVNTLRKAVAAAMLMQYRNLGFMLDKWGEQYKRIAPFFDLQTIRQRPQQVFRGTLGPAESHAVLVHTFTADDELQLKITGPSGALFYLASHPNGTNSNPVEVQANQPLTVAVNQFGITTYKKHRYLTLVNPSDEATIKFLVKIE
jgi:hypothetical protein